MARGLSRTGRADEQHVLTVAPRRAPDRRRVVVTGMGMITPLGRNARETFARASQSCSGIDYIRGFDTRGLPVRIGGEIADQWIRRPQGGPAAKLEKMASRAVRFMWTAATEAVEQAKLDRIRDRYRIGVALGYHGATASRPFDRKRSGFVISEGAGALVLEDLVHARERGAPILGELLGYGDSTDAYRITDIHPQAEGAVLAMVRAIEDAGIERADVDYVNAHGTSTVQNDALETLAVKRVFGARAASLPLSSNKSMLGHTIGAAGAIEAILTLEGIRESVLLPTINYETPDPRCDLDYVPNQARPFAHRIALSNSFGFGGHNASVCIGAYEDC